MWRFTIPSMLFLSLIFSSGCLFIYNGDKIIRKSEMKRSVQFESEEAALIFHEKYKATLCSCQNKDSEHESIVIPFIMATNTKTKLSESACYNDAIRICDLDNDNTISLVEAKTYSQL